MLNLIRWSLTATVSDVDWRSAFLKAYKEIKIGYDKLAYSLLYGDSDLSHSWMLMVQMLGIVYATIAKSGMVVLQKETCVRKALLKRGVSYTGIKGEIIGGYGYLKGKFINAYPKPDTLSPRKPFTQTIEGKYDN